MTEIKMFFSAAMMAAWTVQGSVGNTAGCGSRPTAQPRDPYAYQPLQVTAEHPQAIVTNAAGHVLLDFGKDAVGWFEFAGGSGGAYEIVLGELTNASGSVAMEYPKSNIRLTKVAGEKGEGLFRVPLPPDKFNLKGYDPKAPAIRLPEKIGTVMPFRYVEVVKAPVSIARSAFVRQMVSYPIDLSRSDFSSDSEALNRVYDFCKYSIKATSFCGCYVDGDRERTPYEADAYINQLAHYAIEDDYSLARFSHEWLMEHPTWPTEWKQHSIMMAWADWMWTGDARSLEKYYDRLVHEKLDAGWTVRADGLMVTSGDARRGPRDIVDWPPVERDGFVLTKVNAVVNAFRYRNLRELADIARALGHGADAARFTVQADALKEVYNRVFFDEASGLYMDGEGVKHASLHANAAALAFGLVPEARQAKALDFLERKGMACSVYFSQYLLEAFFLNGRPEVALKLITAKGDRGWLGMMDFGSTVTMEAWNVAAKPNLDLNHAWSATPLSMISRFILGVTPLKPGFRELRVAPQPGGLKAYSGVIPTAAGFVKVAVAGEKLTVDSPVPAEIRWQGRTYRQPAGAAAYPPPPAPWSHLNFADDPEDFRFVVIPDRGGGDYRGAFTNALKCADMMHPAFVISVGDEANGFRRTYEKTAEEKDELTNMVAKVRAPFFHVVGNHDINISFPTGPYTNNYEITRKVWRDYFGPSEYYSFVYKNCLFLVLNSMEQYRTTAKRPVNGISAEQYAWAAKELAKHPDVRWTFLFNHHPSEWLSKAWNDFERAHLASRKYTVFGGDWHSYFHAKRRGHDYYALSVAGGVSNMAYLHQYPDRSSLKGPEYGEMDHITWVTMAKDGPEVVNLRLDGVYPGDYLNRVNSKDDTIATVLDDPPSPEALEKVREIAAKMAAEKAAREAATAVGGGSASNAADEEGFVSLFNGKDLTGWVGNTEAYYVESPGVLACGPREGKTLAPDDALMTVREYADFIIRFDCQIEPGADNGLGIRYPGVDDMAYSGIEMQLADTAKVTDRTDTWRTMGGFYGVSYALDDRTATQKVIGGTYVKPCGEWNQVELRAEGSRLTAYLNGVKVNECDLATKSPDTGYDRHPHAGVRAKKGHIVWWVGNPKKTVRWRNLRIKELKSADCVDVDKRRFLYSDFMNRKIVYVDEANPAAYWEAFFPEICFDLTLAGLHRLYVAQRQGWREYTLSQRQFVREVKDPAHMKFVTSACEGPDGLVYALEQKGDVHVYTRTGEYRYTCTFPPVVRHGRALRFTSCGTALIGIDDGVAEVKLAPDLAPEARLVKTFTIPGSRSAYQGVYLPNGNLLATGGYLPTLATFAPDGRILARRTANQTDGLSDFFYGGFDVQPNGNVILANWTGHNGRDFIPGLKLIEFDEQGRVVWKWNAPWAGTPNAVLAFGGGKTSATR